VPADVVLAVVGAFSIVSELSVVDLAG